MSNLYVLLANNDGKKHLFRVYKNNNGSYYTEGTSLCGKIKLNRSIPVNREDIIHNVKTTATKYFSTESIIYLNDDVCHLCRGFAS